MRVRVIPYGELRRLIHVEREPGQWIELPERSTVATALRRVGADAVDQLIVGVDGEYATPDTPLHDGAEMVLVTPMEGG